MEDVSFVYGATVVDFGNWELVEAVDWLMNSTCTDRWNSRRERAD